LQGLDKLANWPAVLDQFRKTLLKSQKTVEFTSPSEDHSRAFQLLRLITRNHTTKNYTAIEANFLFAAMHIACMQEIHFPKAVCPDLPDNLESLVRG